MLVLQMGLSPAIGLLEIVLSDVHPENALLGARLPVAKGFLKEPEKRPGE